MTRLGHQLRFPLVAFAAIVGTLSLFGEASACGMKAAPKVARSCCVKRTLSACGCCVPDQGLSTPATGQRLVARGDTGVALAASQQGCECHLQEPAAPARKTEPVSTETVTERDLATQVACVYQERRLAVFTPGAARLIKSPKTPLYLRISRLIL